MASITFRTLWTVEVRHAFFGGACDALAFTVPPSTERALAGAHAMARQREGRLLVLIEVDEAGQPLSPLAGLRLTFGLQPRQPSFDCFTTPSGLPRGAAALWSNAANADVLAGPDPLHISGEQLRIEPHAAGRPLTLRLFDAAGVQRAQTLLDAGDEAWTVPGRFPRGSWRVEEQAGGTPHSWSLRVEPEMAGAWGVLDLHVAAAHLAGGHTFGLAFAARSDTLRYYVVASRFGEADFNQVQVQDTGFAAEARPEIRFTRRLPPFAQGLLSPALLDPSGSARIALFEAGSALPRRARGPRGLALQRNGDVLVADLPQPGADRPDAQFVVHLSQS